MRLMINNQTIGKLFDLCNKPDRNLSIIEDFIISNKATDEEITRAAIMLADKNGLEIMQFEGIPSPDKLISTNFVELFDLFIRYGLLPNYIYTDNNIDYYNIIEEIRYIDNGNTAPIIMRKLMEIGGNPNIVVGNDPIFRDLDFDITFDVTELDNKRLFDIEFKIWLVMMGYGGVINDGKCPVKMKESYSVDIFKKFENFDYKIEFSKNDWTMHIFDIYSKEVIATL